MAKPGVMECSHAVVMHGTSVTHMSMHGKVHRTDYSVGRQQHSAADIRVSTILIGANVIA
jgi:hypothetical protein